MQRCSVNVDLAESVEWAASDPVPRLASFLRKTGLPLIDRSPCDAFTEHLSKWMLETRDRRTRGLEYLLGFTPGASGQSGRKENHHRPWQGERREIHFVNYFVLIQTECVNAAKILLDT